MPSSRHISSPAMIERCSKIPTSPGTDEVREEEAKEMPRGQQQQQQRSSFSQHCHHEKNIVFIEERKILVIPTNGTTSSTKTTDI